MYYSIYCNIFTHYIILYHLSFNILIIHILGNIFSLRKGTWFSHSVLLLNLNFLLSFN